MPVLPASRSPVLVDRHIVGDGRGHGQAALRIDVGLDDSLKLHTDAESIRRQVDAGAVDIVLVSILNYRSTGVGLRLGDDAVTVGRGHLSCSRLRRRRPQSQLPRRLARWR